LVALAGLFLESLGKVRRLDVGINLEDTRLVSVNLQGLGVPAKDILRFYQRASDRIRTIPGVAAAGFTFAAPFRQNIGGRIKVPGRDTLPRLAGGGPYWFAVGPGTLEAYGVRLLQGRLFTDADRAGSAPVAVVTRRMAETIWPNESAIGKCFIVGADSMPCREVVGVVGDVNRQEIDESPFFLFFSVLEQDGPDPVPHYLVVRTAPGVTEIDGPIRRALAEERADLPYVQIRPYQEIFTEQARPWRLGATLLAVFAGLSLVIAGIGLYGVVAFAVSQRTRELGLRAALGASSGRLLRAVTASGVGTAAAGAVLGIALAIVVGPRIQPLLFHTRASNPIALGLAALTVVLVSLIAAWVPGRRATRLDPIQALRVE
jgi:predicted permease